MRGPEHYIRPSSMSAIDACPGRPQMEALCWNRFAQHLVDGDGEESSDVASMGTDCHAIVAHCLLQWSLWGINPQDSVEDASLQFPELSGWDIGCVRSAIRYVWRLIEKHSPDPDNVQVELFLPGDRVGIRRGGTADLVIIAGPLVVVTDFKFGFLAQDDAANNDQLASYAVMAADMFPVADAIEVHIYQPRLDADERASAARFETRDLRETAEWMRQVVTDARACDAELNPGLSQCLYCSATQCPARREWLMNIKEATEQLPERATPEFAGQLFAAAKVADGWFNDKAKGVKAWAKAYRQMHGPGSIAGFKLKQSGDQRYIRDSEMHSLWAIADAQGLTEQIKELATIPLGKLEAVAGDNFAAFEPIIDKKPKAPALVAGKEEAP